VSYQYAIVLGWGLLAFLIYAVIRGGDADADE